AWRHAPPPAKPKANATAEQRQRYLDDARKQSLGVVATEELALLRCWLDEHGQAQRSLWVVVDGGYTNQTVLTKLPARTVLVGRIRADAKLYMLPDATVSKGRPRIYGAVAPTPEQLRCDEAVAWQKTLVFIGGQQREVRF